MTNQTPTREVAVRAFAAELNDATHTFKQSTDERAPNYALLPTGFPANRVFVVGTLTDSEDVSGDDKHQYWRARVNDTTGTFTVYAGPYQPDVVNALSQLDAPARVAIVGKPRTFETDNGTVRVSIQPEELQVVGEVERDEWIRETATATLDRIEAFDDSDNEYGQMAIENYGTNVEQYVENVIEALQNIVPQSSNQTHGESTGKGINSA